MEHTYSLNKQLNTLLFSCYFMHTYLHLECVSDSKSEITSECMHPGPSAMPSPVLSTFCVQTLLVGSVPLAFLGISKFLWV